MTTSVSCLDQPDTVRLLSTEGIDALPKTIPPVSASHSNLPSGNAVRTDNVTPGAFLSPASGEINRLVSTACGIKRLPYELLVFILRELSLESIYALAQTCHHFGYLIRDEKLCKMLLKRKASFSVEAEQAEQDNLYARALRRLVKRRRAISQASPFAVGIVGVAESYSIFNGKLLYIVGDRPERRLRILDLTMATNQEIVIDIPKLVFQAIPESAGCNKYVFRVLYHSAGITSCLYSYARPTTRNWLLIFNAQEHQLIDKIPLDSTIRLFVRNNSKYLLFGTHSHYDAHGTRKWVLRHYNIQTHQLARDKMHLPNLVGYEIGSTVCFEIFDSHFYGCSNLTSFSLEEIDWTSHYYCFRFHLEDFNAHKIETMDRRDAFRRQHMEGPIDDRFTFLNFDRDEETGVIRIIECRREWHHGGSQNMRTYYNKVVQFRGQQSPSAISSDEDSLRGDRNDPLPDVQLASLITTCDRPNYMKAPKRHLHEYHPGDPGSAIFAKNKTYLSWYAYSCGTFIDLVDDPPREDLCKQRIRIRGGFKTPQGSVIQHSPHQKYIYSQANDRLALHNTISCWPPEVTPPILEQQPDIPHRLDMAMNPAGFCGNITASSDHRTIVYSTSNGEAGALKALICIWFDPIVRLAGMTRSSCLHADIVGHTDNNESTYQGSYAKDTSKTVHGIGRWPCCRRIDAQEEVKSNTSSPLLQVPWSAKQDLRPGALPPPVEGRPWASIEAAMHQKFQAKFDFSYSRYSCARDSLV